jgi:hypothetical protein
VSLQTIGATTGHIARRVWSTWYDQRTRPRLFKSTCPLLCISLTNLFLLSDVHLSFAASPPALAIPALRNDDAASRRPVCLRSHFFSSFDFLFCFTRKAESLLVTRFLPAFPALAVVACELPPPSCLSEAGRPVSFHIHLFAELYEHIVRLHRLHWSGSDSPC